jgi:hypothetical protein
MAMTTATTTEVTTADEAANRRSQLEETKEREKRR